LPAHINSHFIKYVREQYQAGQTIFYVDGVVRLGSKETVRMAKSRVLLVEDEVLIRAMLADVLADEGYEVVEAGTVLQAVAALGRYPTFDFMITDVDMPGGLTGLDLAQMVASVAPATRILVTSGRGISADLLTGWQFLPKPYSIEGILEILGERLPADEMMLNQMNAFGC